MMKGDESETEGRKVRPRRKRKQIVTPEVIDIKEEYVDKSVYESERDAEEEEEEYVPTRSKRRRKTFGEKKNLKGQVYKCEECDKTFPFKSFYKQHMWIHSDNKVCEICNKVCKNKLSLLRHLRSAHETEVLKYRCGNNDCNQSFLCLKDRKQHEIEAHDVAKEIYTCEECDKTFPFKSFYKQHMWIHSDNKVCEICNKVCKNKLSLLRHLRSAHETEVLKYRCGNNDCNKSFLYLKDQKQHEIEAHDVAKEIYTCEECDKTFPFKSVYERHILIHSDDNICDICKKVCKNNLSLQRHKKIVHVGKGGDRAKDVPLRYPCRSINCDKSFVYLRDRAKHEKEVHDGTALQCQVCFQTFSLKCLYDRHMLTHTGRQKCDVCDKVCKNVLNLQKHKKMHTQGKAMCQYCGKTFNERSRLLEHESLHVNGKQFECKICKKRLVSQSYLKVHMQHHTGYKFVCMHCGKGCLTKPILQEHEAIHTGEKPNKCPECDECFRTNQQLRNHRLFHQDMRFQCDICCKKFRWKCDLNSHTQVHMGQRKYKCDMCDKKFNNQSNMRAHKKQVHFGIKRTGHSKIGRPHRTLLHRPDSDAVPAKVMKASKKRTARYDTESPSTTNEAQVTSNKKLLHRPYSDAFAVNFNEAQAASSSGVHHPALRQYASSAEKAQQQEPSGSRSYQYSVIRPDHSEFFSMVDTLIQFPKDN
ncbi:uncharacterized protein [Amphiura filiformis]|uniref:uncharacterized protein n=1 Tax=Amphiura filiformis TaxID=82378 RepID=UPI003B222430